MIELVDIQRARDHIRSYIHQTPIIHSNSFSKMAGADVYLKAENLQKTGSFKVRGAFNRMMNVAGDKVIAASMGNHAQGVAFAASSLRKEAKIVMPINASLSKQEATKGYGAEVVIHGQTFQEALDYAMSRKDHAFIHTFDDDFIIAGQGTIGLEIMEDLKDSDCILIPVGGGGLIAGISVAVKSISPETKVVGVQTHAATSAHASFREKKIIPKKPLPTIADGIAVDRIGHKNLEIMNEYVDDVIAVNEDSISKAILLFLERKKLVVEGAGAVPLAALLENKERYRGRRVVLVVSGGNIDSTLIDRIIRKGLVSSGRMVTIEVIVNDIPGSLHAVTGIIAEQGGNILEVAHDRLAGDISVGKTKLVFTIETRGKDHIKEVIADLTEQGYAIRKMNGT